MSNYCVYPCSLHSASTRKVYEKKLQKLLDQPPAEPEPEPEVPTDLTALPKADTNQNGNTNSDQYSDKEDGELRTHTARDLNTFHSVYQDTNSTNILLLVGLSMFTRLNVGGKNTDNCIVIMLHFLCFFRGDCFS